ncbi:MAG TPA: AsmA family protein, partial [Terriglobales bacterium]|nr:AsmA family protein [Terriglobales bacterium]
MRKAAVIILSIVVLIIIAALVIPSFLDVNQYHGKIQAELQQRLGRQVTLGNMHLRLLPLSFRVDNVTIGEDPHFPTGRPFAEAQEVDVSVKLLPLLHKDIEISSL